MGSQRQPFTNVLIGPLTFILTDSYVELYGTMLDSLRFGNKWLSWNVVESNNKGATVKIQGSIDGSTWVDLQAQKTDGTAFSAVDVACSANSNVQIFITDDGVTSSPDVNGGYRFYRMQGKNTVGGNVAKITVVGIVK